MGYNLTEKQREILRWVVAKVREGSLHEEFHVSWHSGGYTLIGFTGSEDEPKPELSPAILDALEREGMLHCRVHQMTSRSGSTFEASRTCIITGRAYEAVDSNFSAPDTSFVQHLTPLADLSGFDPEIKRRCLPILGAGSADPALWDSAVRTCGVILEERIRDVGGITDSNRVGRDLVNAVFGSNGTLASKFENPAELLGYRDLYAGIVGAFRNPFAHRLIDPSPEDGGAFIVFVNLLLRKLETLR